MGQACSPSLVAPAPVGAPSPHAQPTRAALATGFVAVEIPFTPRAKRVLELALEEARLLGHSYIGTEHLLLGLLREGEGVAARVLENLDADSAKIRSQARLSLPGHIPSRWYCVQSDGPLARCDG